MKIINPLYDNAFKYLMDNEQIARKILTIILNQEVIALQSKPQETTVYTDQYSGTARYDFKAIIRNANNEESCVLIELQKYNNPNPIVRFREYLGDNYKKEETIIDASGKEVKQSLPIITIYILGYKVTKAEILAFKVDRNIVDIIWDISIDELPEFVEKLTHTCIVLQVNAKPAKLRNTRLEKFISLFSQKLKNEESNYVIELQEDKVTQSYSELTEIVNYLERATLDEKIVRSLKYEASYEQGIKDIEQILLQTQMLAEQERAERRQAEERAEQERAERRQAEERAEQERKEKDSIKKVLYNTIRKQYKKGISVEELAEMYEIEMDEIRNILE